ncbi:rhomboid family intramembrane serine protease [Actinophytocola algeriensis]|uniref:rhomboid family intramembrane serine protease n=1 Tax=Actinophytocola algeriensis TaxID=1768010 RepID=UPI0019F560AB|nr:rhomboid family intramembrane serine protease [Actinophytocola algeriensis]MBE1478204.1 membrane associated rhomboid family serine protease [Actinophytocola algeriensis]
MRHPDRPTGLRCVRCERPACPDCLREASVGYQCVDCVAEGNKSVRPARNTGGARTRSSARSLVVVPVLIGLNVLIFAITAVQAGSITQNQRSELFVQGTLIPSTVAAGDFWRLLTSGFLHFGNYGGYGPVHLVFNMFALYVIGRDLEVALGKVRFLVVYLLALLGGSTAVMLFGDPLGSVAGASGAIYGLFGGIAVVVFRAKLNPTPVLMLLGVNIFLSVALPGISLLGHLGGLVVGALATAALVYAPRQNLVRFQTIAVAAIAVLIVAMLVTSAATMDMSCEVTSSELLSCFQT